MSCEYNSASPASTSRTAPSTTSQRWSAAGLTMASMSRWAPKWVTPGDPHGWQELDKDSPSGAWHFRECLTCSRMTRHTNSDQADADYRSQPAEVHQIRTKYSSGQYFRR